MKSQTAIRGGSATVSDDGVFVESSTAAGDHSPNNRDNITNNFHLSSSQSSLLSTSSFSPKVKLETQTRLKYSFLANKRPDKNRPIIDLAVHDHKQHVAHCTGMTWFRKNTNMAFQSQTLALGLAFCLPPDGQHNLGC